MKFYRKNVKQKKVKSKEKKPYTPFPPPPQPSKVRQLLCNLVANAFLLVNSSFSICYTKI